MFGSKGQDVFEQRQKQREVWKHIRRIVDRSTPNWSGGVDAPRADERYNRTVPVLLAPVEDDEPVAERALYTVTKDLSDNGVSVLIAGPMEPGPVICGFWIDSPFFLLGEIRRCFAIGGGFWQMGIELTDVVSISDHPRLARMAQRLLPDETLQPA